jgi:hypothetical protein
MLRGIAIEPTQKKSNAIEPCNLNDAIDRQIEVQSDQ